MQTAVSETDCKAPARQLALTDNPGNIHKGYNCVVMEIFIPLMATGDSLTDV